MISTVEFLWYNSSVLTTRCRRWQLCILMVCWSTLCFLLTCGQTPLPMCSTTAPSRVDQFVNTSWCISQVSPHYQVTNKWCSMRPAEPLSLNGLKTVQWRWHSQFHVSRTGQFFTLDFGLWGKSCSRLAKDCSMRQNPVHICFQTDQLVLVVSCSIWFPSDFFFKFVSKLVLPCLHDSIAPPILTRGRFSFQMFKK